ncbi:MAG: hypothetical protein M3388_18460 [Acidobacteriota bacterium]|nr:hypothetical protein [Acidobacteriota bacterium]
MWGERFNQPFSDVFEIQEKIAASISEKLRLRIGDSAKISAYRKIPQNVSAYTLYLKGRYFWSQKKCRY